MNAWRIIGKVCAAVVIVSVLACVAMAISRSRGLTAVTVTALDPTAEPADPSIPLIQKREALPDYELAVIRDNGRVRYLGVKPDESAASGLTWRLSDPVSISQIATVRLREKDKLVSDALAEVHVADAPVDANGYRFVFETKRSIGVGVQAFFATPIGIAIALAFGLAVLLIILASIAG
jgi:hypothetical protein